MKIDNFVKVGAPYPGTIGVEDVPLPSLPTGRADKVHVLPTFAGAFVWYRCTNVRGAGVRGVVDEARKENREGLCSGNVAIKVQSDVDDGKDEARCLRACGHPNVVAQSEAFCAQGKHMGKDAATTGQPQRHASSKPTVPMSFKEKEQLPPTVCCWSTAIAGQVGP